MPVISKGDLSIQYALSGHEDGDLLVLSNSLGSDFSMWNKVLAPLEAEFHVLRYDTRGHGASSVPPGPYSLNDLGQDVLLLLNEIGAHRVNFCGLSLGGLIGMWLGLKAPHRLNRLVLANTAARIGSPEMWDERVSAVRRSGMEALASATPARWFTAQYREAHPSEMKQIQAMIASTSADGYIACCAALRESDLRAGIPSMAVPSLVIAGTHDPATPPSDGRELAAALPRAHYVELDSSHLSAWERADEFVNAVLTFLAN
ncbi:MAG TPA: 3-oxoadipate enol-lactonase [Terracidiphilus sp.]|nr:3-oxoadipate enol-lactonase [Terracidiphilus sp.]